jgi:hypothetical protein
MFVQGEQTMFAVLEQFAWRPWPTVEHAVEHVLQAESPSASPYAVVPSQFRQSLTAVAPAVAR